MKDARRIKTQEGGVCGMGRGCRFEQSGGEISAIRDIIAMGEKPKAGTVRRHNVPAENHRP